MNTFLCNVLVYSSIATFLRSSLSNAFIQYSSKEEPSKKKNSKEKFLGCITSERTLSPNKCSPASSFVSCVNSYHLAHGYRFPALSPSTAQPVLHVHILIIRTFKMFTNLFPSLKGYSKIFPLCG